MRSDFILRTGTRFLTAAVVALLLFLGADQTDTAFLWRVCLLLLPAAGTVFLERRDDQTALFYGGEFLLLLFALTGAGAAERQCLFAACLTLVVPSLLSTGAFARNILGRSPVAEGILFAAGYLAAGWKEAGYAYQFFLYFLGVGFMVAHFYWKNQHGRKLFLDAAGNRVAEGQEQQVKRVNKRSLRPFLLIVLLISVLAWIPMGSQALAEAVENGYTDMMEGINEMFEDMPDDFVIMFGEEPAGEGEQELVAPEGGEEAVLPEPEPQRDLRLLQFLIEATMVLLLALAAGLLFLIIRRFAREPELQKRDAMQQEYQIDIAEKSTRLPKRKTQRRESDGSGSENHKIRRSYHGAVGGRLRAKEHESDRRVARSGRGGAGAEVTQGQVDYQAMTPLELERAAGLRTGAVRTNPDRADKPRHRHPESRMDGSGDAAREEKLLRLHELYEKARYGREACTREESREAEGLAKGL